jgi:UDP-N-acetylmuramoyl-L-alanyl-D-glutamate--2,6-diaminopimelate ligase
LRVHGGSGLYNGALAATAALCAGAPAQAVREALAAFPPPPRRMQIVHDGDFTILDDTVGHPESVSALFRVVRRIPHRRLHVAFAVRGRRGIEINRQIAKSLAIWSRRVPLSTLVVTSSVEAADERNRVDEAERAVFVEPLHAAGLPVVEAARLKDAVHQVLDRARDGDLVLLLGAQGMDRGAPIANAWLQGR